MTIDRKDKKFWRKVKIYKASPKRYKIMPPKVGETIGKWTVLNAWVSMNGKLMAFETKCECGHIEKYMNVSNLKGGGSLQCKSCAAKDNSIIEIGEYKSLYSSMEKPMVDHYIRMLKSMVQKSKRSTTGLQVHQDWIDKPLLFIMDMSSLEGSLDKDLLPDRIDTFGHYAPNNIRFITQKENQRNQRNTVYVSFKGEQVPVTRFLESQYGVQKKEENISLYKKVLNYVKEGKTGETILKLVKF